jgi:peptidoglycan/xylan/chitin deacetylase (PgdA/CDA1 family)
VGEVPASTDPHNLVVPPDRFRNQLELLAEAGFEFVTVADFADRIPVGGKPPPGLIAVSFDDGMEDNHSVALPLLHALRVPATVYVLTGAIGAPNPWLSPDARQRMMSREELRVLHEAGIELGAHTVNHPDMSALGFEACLAEAEQSRDTVASITNGGVRTFAYPFGHYGPAAIEAARAAGFEAAVTCVNRGSWEPYELRRTLITGRDGIWSFVARVSGIYEPLVLGRAGAIARRGTASLRRRLTRRAAA